ncbi:MAG: helix-turn-helix transcriptional regulator [Rubrivivax sp.]|nr:helix-turn-helix transcriptional regulator [Rubrivivax sp.]
MTMGEAFRFGPGGRFELQPLERRLRVDGQPAALGARAFDLLVALAARPGELLTKQVLIEAVWPDVVVEEGNLATQISALRKVLGGEVIATIPGRGYRFTARAAAVESAASPAPAAGAAASSPVRLPPEADTPADVAAPALHTHLPAELPPLIGRADDLAALGELAARHRLISIVGAGGMGKTRLAQAFLHGRQHAFPHGVCWVDLSNVTDAAAVPSAIGAALGVRVGSGKALQGLCSAVAPLDMLVALDNAEHLLDGTAEAAQALLDAAPALRLVVTSQAPLKLPLEWVYRLEALAVPPGPLPLAEVLGFGAVALFVERARAADHRFGLTEATGPAAIELCRRLDGLPLALELAAARAPMFGVAQLAASMDERLRLLGGGRHRRGPARHQTLRATLEWSHGFLDEAERTVFRRLAVFAGSGSLAMVRRVLADDALDEWTVLDALALLVERSLVVALTPLTTPEPQAPEAGTEPRYRLLDTTRLYALERLREAGEEAEVRRRHARAVAARFDAALHERYDGSIGVEEWMTRLSADLDNGRQALAWALAEGDATAALTIAATLFRALPLALHDERGRICDRCEPLLAGVARVDLRVRMGVLVSTHFHSSNAARAMRAARRAVEDTRALADDADARWLRYEALSNLALNAARTSDLDTAGAALMQARKLEDAAWPPLRRLRLSEAEYAFAAASDDPAAALRLGRADLAIRRSAGDPSFMTQANLVDLELAAGNAAAAARDGAALVEALEGGRDPRSLTWARLNLGAAWLALDDTARARAALQAGWGRAATFFAQMAYADYLALLAALEHRCRAAARLAGYADARNAAASPRQPNEAAAIARAAGLARAALGDALFERLHAEGARLPDEDVAGLAFAEVDAGADRDTAVG